MNNTVKNGVGILLGIVVGGVVNMGLVILGPLLIPPPEGIDMTTVEGMTAGMELLGPQHFLSPWLAHALGTFVGALTTYKIAASHRQAAAYLIGGFYLVGGIAASSMIPAPLWFVVLDLVGAYIPMAWLALRVGRALESPDQQETTHE